MLEIYISSQLHVCENDAPTLKVENIEQIQKSSGKTLHGVLKSMRFEMVVRIVSLSNVKKITCTHYVITCSMVTWVA